MPHQSPGPADLAGLCPSLSRATLATLGILGTSTISLMARRCSIAASTLEGPMVDGSNCGVT